jgi:hypothetical protein
MEVVLKFEAKNLQKIKDILLKDDIASRASITFKEGSFVNLEGYFCYFSGTDDQVKRAKEIVKEVAKEAEQKDRDKVIRKIKEEETKATEGLGGIFG